MLPLERVPAVRRIETDRSDLFAIEITDEFTSADAENLCGLLEGAYALHPRLDLLIRLRELTSVDTYDLAPETHELLRSHARNSVRHCAVVGNASRRSEIADLLAFAPTTTVRQFDSSEEPEAWAWLSANEIPERV